MSDFALFMFQASSVVVRIFTGAKSYLRRASLTPFIYSAWTNSTPSGLIFGQAVNRLSLACSRKSWETSIPTKVQASGPSLQQDELIMCNLAIPSPFLSLTHPTSFRIYRGRKLDTHPYMVLDLGFDQRSCMWRHGKPDTPRVKRLWNGL